MTALLDGSVGDVAASVARGEVRAEDLCAAALARIERHDRALGAFLHVSRDRALEAARAIDLRRARGERLGRLAGVPIAVKDSLCTMDAPTTAGSRILEGWTPPYDATVVERLRAADAVLVGKTNMDELGMGSSTEHSAYFPCRNPWDLARTPGGSSGGSAAAVSARLAVAALGSDTGGSIRQPAAFTGTVGIKPTYGRVSRFGLVAFASSLDQVGVVARDVRGAAEVLEVVAGHDPRDSTSSVHAPALRAPVAERAPPARVGVLDLGAGTLDPDVAAAFDEAIDALRGLGCQVTRVAAPASARAVATYYVLAAAEASSNLSRLDGVRYGLRVPGDAFGAMLEKTRDQGFGAEVKRRILLGTFVLSRAAFEEYYRKAQRVRRLVRDELLGALADVDVLATPTTPTPAFVLGERARDPLAMYTSDLLTLPPSLAGLPALSLPCGLSPGGLPIGLQLVGRPFDEAALLDLAAALERRRPLGASPRGLG